MNEWINELAGLCAVDEPAVLVTVAGIRGSAPREIGAKMIVTPRETIGTIGGGQLEFQSTRVAVDLLDDERMTLRSFALGSSMGQCCGGVVEILFEPLVSGMPAWLRDLQALYAQREPAVMATRLSTSEPAKLVVTAEGVFGVADDRADAELVAAARSILGADTSPRRDVRHLLEPVVVPDLNIAVFGAGHVGTAVVETLARLDCNIRWVDSRRNVFRGVPNNVSVVETPDPSQEVLAMSAGAYYLVMTHSHALDFDICDRILRRGDARYCGLIGSVTKRRRFEKRYRRQGMRPAMIDRLVCPIGIAGVSGKKPAEIAVATAAEILSLRSAAANAAADFPGNVRPLRR